MAKKNWNIITTVILVVLLVGIATIYIPKFVGYEPMVVLSGSMEPTYHVGSLLYIKDVDTDDIEVGDAITFYLDSNTLATHRVISIDENAGTYTTKGDANDVDDGNALTIDQIKGKPAFNVPVLGYVAEKITSKSGKILYITAIVVDVILMYMSDLIFGPDKKKEKQVEEKEENSDEKEDE